MKHGRVLWFTGLSGSGKSTLATALAAKLAEQKLTVKTIDGDDVRSTLHKHLGFTPPEIAENNRLIVQLCQQFLNEYDFLLVPVIAPFAASRAAARRTLGDRYHELYVKAPLKVCIDRDVKGLYQKALAGEIPHFIGVADDVPYEEPTKPELTLDTTQHDAEKLLDQILNYINLLPKPSHG